jgi:hypothetical protein
MAIFLCLGGAGMIAMVAILSWQQMQMDDE